MGNKELTAWYICDTCKKHKHGFEYDILENGARDKICDECKVKILNIPKEPEYPF